MRKIPEDRNMKCPSCGKSKNQVKKGNNRSGTQRIQCKECGKTYTINPKKRAYSEETRQLATKMYYSGVSGRGVGKALGMDKANVYHWIKKNHVNVDNFYETLELDELYWFIERKSRIETRENIYIMTMVSQNPHQIVGFDIACDKSPERIQKMVDEAPGAARYCSDGYWGYVDVVYPGRHIHNIHDKSDTYTVEGVNADLSHYIPILARRSRCFARKLETLRAVIEVFVDAYNRFGRAKHHFRQFRQIGEIPFSVFDFI
jgi:transposase-like protein/IS1 family transposase